LSFKRIDISQANENVNYNIKNRTVGSVFFHKLKITILQKRKYPLALYDLLEFISFTSTGQLVGIFKSYLRKQLNETISYG